MKFSAQLTFWFAVAMCVLCVAYALFGFTSTDEATMTAQEIDDARGYVWFWLFLGGVAGVIAIVSALMAKGKLGAGERE